MSRHALVIGIKRYPFQKEKPTDKGRELESPVGDAEAIARLLELYGSFEVQRIPAWPDYSGQFYPKGLVKEDDLRAEIIKLFKPQAGEVDTALLYFAGLGLRREYQNENGEVKTEGFLATSDSKAPRENTWGISLKWLRELLQESPVQQQVIWLDCSYSGELFNFTETDEVTKKHDQCFIVAAKSNEKAAARNGRGLLSKIIVEAIDPKRNSTDWVTNQSLSEFINSNFSEKTIQQNPECKNTGNKEIILTGAKGVPLERSELGNHPLQKLWDETKGWLVDNNTEDKNTPLVRLHEASVVAEKFIKLSTEKHLAEDYKQTIQTKLGFTFPESESWSVWTKPSVAFLHESLKCLCGDTFLGRSKDKGSYHISTGAAYLIALMAYSANEGKDFNPFIVKQNNEEVCLDLKEFPKVTLPLFPSQNWKDARNSAMALYDLFDMMFKSNVQLQGSPVEKVEFSDQGKIFKIYLNWSATTKVDGREDSLAEAVRLKISQQTVIIPVSVGQTREAVLRLWRCMLINQDGFGSPGTVFIKNYRENQSVIVIAASQR